MQILLNILISFSTYLIIALSFNLIYQTAKFFHFAHAGIITLAPYLLIFFLKQLKLNIFVSISFAILSAIVLGICLEVGIYKPLRKKVINSFILLIASLGLYIIIQNTISLIWGDDTKLIPSGNIKVGYELLGGYITYIQIITFFINLILCFSMLILMEKTKLGKKIRAVTSNDKLSNIFGISSDSIILSVFLIGSGLAAVAGITVAFDIGMTPTMGFNLLLYGVVAMIIGGVGNTLGLIFGSLLLSAAQHLGAYYIGSKWMDAIAYFILILFLIWKPLGFSGKQLKKIEI